MTTLLRFKRPVATIFDLLGSREDDQTYALGFVLSRSHVFLSMFLARLLGEPCDSVDSGIVSLQSIEGEHGRTDIQLVMPHRLFGIVEAKVGANFPSTEQLAKYRAFLDKQEAPRKLLAARSRISLTTSRRNWRPDCLTAFGGFHSPMCPGRSVPMR